MDTQHTATERRNVTDIQPIRRGSEASALADAEYGRFLDLLCALEGDEWTRPTDCTEWNVHQILAHQVGHGEAWASLREFFHQARLGLPLARRKGVQPVDGQNEVQVREREGIEPAELIRRLQAVRPKAVRGRSRRSWMRPMRFNTPGIGSDTFGRLYDVIITRDTWIHRVDVSRATGRAMVLTPEHDGRLIEDIVRDWARLHGRPFTLELLGPAGGTFVSADGEGEGEQLTLDAVEFARIVSGRAPGEGLLAQQVLF